MSAPARLLQSLDPLYLASGWRQPFVFYDEDEAGVVTDADLTGWTAVLSMVSRGPPAAARQLTVGAGLTLVSAQTVVAERQPDDQVGWVDGTYDVELQLINPSAQVFSVLVAKLPVIRGPAAASTGGGGVTPGLPGGSSASRTLGVIRAATGEVRLIRVAGGGVPTDAAYVRFDDSLAGLGATDVNAAIVAIWAELLAPQDDFDIPENSGLGLVLGVY